MIMFSPLNFGMFLSHRAMSYEAIYKQPGPGKKNDSHVHVLYLGIVTHLVPKWFCSMH